MTLDEMLESEDRHIKEALRERDAFPPLSSGWHDYDHRAKMHMGFKRMHLLNPFVHTRFAASTPFTSAKTDYMTHARRM